MKTDERDGWKLYGVQWDRAVRFVAARSFSEAVSRWLASFEGEPTILDAEPEQVTLICDEPDEIVWPEGPDRVVYFQAPEAVKAVSAMHAEGKWRPVLELRNGDRHVLLEPAALGEIEALANARIIGAALPEVLRILERSVVAENNEDVDPCGPSREEWLRRKAARLQQTESR